MAKDEETRLLGGGKAHKNRAFNAIFELPPALACFCILSGVIVVVGFLTFCMWLLALEWNVALYAKHHNVTCDKPLGKWLMAEAAFVSSLLVIYAIIIAWKGNQRNMLMSILAVVTNLGVLILLIMGNSMVFGSKNCKTSTADKIPEPTPLMMSLYNTCKFIVVFSDVLFALALVFIGIAYSHITNPSDSTKGCAALMKGFSLQMAAEDNVSFIGAALRFFQKKSATDEPKKVSPDEESEAEPDVEQPLVDGDQPASDDHNKSQ